MQPPPPVKPQEKLPPTYHLTIITKDPDKSGMVSIVLTKMQGDSVLKRRVMDPSWQTVDHALDEFNRLATRIFYFSEGSEYL